jgi:hypothetical protein
MKQWLFLISALLLLAAIIGMAFVFSPIGKIYLIYHAPISFWGKVIDQNQKPIEAVNVHYEAVDHYFGPSTAYQGTSDSSGLFSINGVGGAGLYVGVSKDGYYQLGEKSMRGFHTGSSDMPTKENPAIFELRKIGKTENLIYFRRDIITDNDGKAEGVVLTNGHPVSAAGGDITLALQSGSKTVPVNSHQQYDWRFQITVPNGGLQERKGDGFDFDAPITGYQPSDTVEMVKGASEWRDSAEREYFLKLADGRYARIKAFVAAEGDFVGITCYLNPISGHQNLEFDPNQANPP